MEPSLLKLVREYLHYLDIPDGWGLGKKKSESLKALRRHVKRHPQKQIVIRRKRDRA